MKRTIFALLCLGGMAFGADATLSWAVDCTNGQYTTTAGTPPLASGYCSTNFIQGTGVQTSGSAADGSGIAFTSNLQALNTEFSIMMSLAEVTTSFNTEASPRQLTLIGMKKSDGYPFAVHADSQTGIISLYLQNAELEENCLNLALAGNTTKAQTITLTFANIENSNNALVSVYLDDQLATSAIMNGNWRTDHTVAANLLTGFGEPGVAAVVSQVSYFNGALTQAQIAELVPEPATATLSLLALAGLAARRRRK